MSFWKSLFGGGKAAGDALSAPARTEDYEGYRIEAAPLKDGDQFLIAGTISKVIGGERRQKPSEAGILAFIPKRGGPNVTTGYLVEGEEKTITRGKGKGGKRIVPKPGGKMMFVLRGWTDHKADESVLPTIVDMQTAAEQAAEAVIETLNSRT